VAPLRCWPGCAAGRCDCVEGRVITTVMTMESAVGDYVMTITLLVWRLMRTRSAL